MYIYKFLFIIFNELTLEDPTSVITFLGVKNLLNLNINNLDDNKKHSLKDDYYKNILKSKSKLLLQKIKKIKNYGKKNSS